MSAASAPRAASPGWSWLAGIARQPSGRAEFCVWLALFAAVVAVRVYLVELVPFAIWSKDAGSYAESADHWLKTGQWITDGRRGPIYSLFIAGCAKAWGSVDGVMIAQHVLGGVAVLFGMLVLRLLWGRSALVPVALCSYAYAVYGLPVSLEHLVRNETLLFFFSSLALSCWYLAIHFRKGWWLLPAGCFGALTMLTKSVYGPFPVLVVGALIFAGWKMRAPMFGRIALFALGFALPYLGVRALDRMSVAHEPPEPQSGILLYGRTAQFTHLDGGLEPELKAAIRAEVEDYRRLPDLDNNVILKRTVVPHLRRILYARGQTPADLNRLCRQLAIEGVLHHPAAYLFQMLDDCRRLHLSTCAKVKAPAYDNLESLEELLPQLDPQTTLVDPQATLTKLRAVKDRNLFRKYHQWLHSAWLFRVAPVLLTTLLLPWLIRRARGEPRLWWIGCAGLWYFTIVLLCTVGRPLERYVIPVAPVMFWTLGSAVCIGWQALTALAHARTETSFRES